MKRPLLATTLLSALLFTSCELDNNASAPGTYPDSAAYVTVEITENLAGDEEEDVYIFETDNGITLFLADDAMSYNYDFTDGERLIIYFALIEKYDEGSEAEGAAYDCDYGLRLFRLYGVHLSESVTVESEEQSEAIADHAISYIYDSIGYSYDYINMVAGIRADDLDDVRFYLVENLAEESGKDEEGYLNLELRYDRGTDEAIGSTYDQYISLNIEQFADQLEDMEGILLRAVTLNSGTIYIKIDIDKEQEEEKVAEPTSRTL